MRLLTAIGSFMTCALLLGAAGPSAAACEPEGDVQFLCGPVSPEDLVAVPQSPWVIVSSMEDDGHLYLADTRDHTAMVLFPTETSRPRHDTATYGSCPGPLTSQFRPHGISLRSGNSDTHTLYVVRHGGRESIEVFQLDAGGESPTLTWLGCVVAPETVSLNSVAALPDGGFAVTNFQRPMGELWEWQPAAGWAKVPGSETPGGPNGLEISRDGQWFYIGGYGSQSLIRLSRGQTPIQKDAVEVGFSIDNVHWAPDGSLFAAGHSFNAQVGIGECLREGQCDEGGVPCCEGRPTATHGPADRPLPLQRPPAPWYRSHSDRGGDMGWRHRRRPDCSVSSTIAVAAPVPKRR